MNRPVGYTVGVLVGLGVLVQGLAQGGGARSGAETETGTIRGQVTIDAGDVPEPVMIDVTADQATCGLQVEDFSMVVDVSGGVANAVVTLVGVPWTKEPPTPIINNAQCYFRPRVQVAKTRSVVSIQSEDVALHSTHAYDDRARTMFNIAIPIPGMVIERPLRRPGVVRVECDSHGWMRGWVYVTNDISTVSESGGGFEIPNVPAGTYELAIWHERYMGRSQTVTVAAQGAVQADFRLE
jgi:hypothetical protein